MEMEINWAAAQFFMNLFLTLFTGAMAVYVWWTGRNRASREAIRAVDRRMDSLEQQLKRRPGYGDLDKMRAEMHDISRGMAEIKAQMQSTNALLNRLHEYLLTERGSK